jgi:hypothetical protein
MSVSLTALRWIARLSALLIAGGYVLLVAGEFLSPHSGNGPDLRAWSGIVLLTVTCAGMLLAWRWELPGAALSLASLIAFAVLIRFNRYTVHFVLALPGILFLADWLLRRRRPWTPAAGNYLMRWISLAGTAGGDHRSPPGQGNIHT